MTPTDKDQLPDRMIGRQSDFRLVYRPGSIVVDGKVVRPLEPGEAEQLLVDTEKAG